MLHANASCVMFLNIIFFASCIRRNDDSIRFRAAFDSRPPIHLSSSRIAFFFSFFIYLFSSFSCFFFSPFISYLCFLYFLSDGFFFSFFCCGGTVWSELRSVWVELGRVELNWGRFRIVVLFDLIRCVASCRIIMLILLCFQIIFLFFWFLSFQVFFCFCFLSFLMLSIRLYGGLICVVVGLICFISYYLLFLCLCLFFFLSLILSLSLFLWFCNVKPDYVAMIIRHVWLIRFGSHRIHFQNDWLFVLNGSLEGADLKPMGIHETLST